MTKIDLEKIAGKLSRKELKATPISKVTSDVICLLEEKTGIRGKPIEKVCTNWYIERWKDIEGVDVLNPYYDVIVPVEPAGLVRKKESGLYLIEGAKIGFIEILSDVQLQKYIFELEKKEEGFLIQFSEKKRDSLRKERKEINEVAKYKTALMNEAQVYGKLVLGITNVIPVYKEQLGGRK